MRNFTVVLLTFVAIGCNKASDGGDNALAASASAVNVNAGPNGVSVTPGGVTVTQGPTAPGAQPKTVTVTAPNGGAQIQAGGKKVAITGPAGQVTITGLPGQVPTAAGAVPATPTPPAPAAPAAHTGPCATLAAKCGKCTIPGLKQTCQLAVASGDPGSCQNGLNDKDVQANCK
jgi:hypothetical protein